jgi:hypothetical protein
VKDLAGEEGTAADVTVAAAAEVQRFSMGKQSEAAVATTAVVATGTRGGHRVSSAGDGSGGSGAVAGRGVKQLSVAEARAATAALISTRRKLEAAEVRHGGLHARLSARVEGGRWRHHDGGAEMAGAPKASRETGGGAGGGRRGSGVAGAAGAGAAASLVFATAAAAAARTRTAALASQVR